jgi:hypothetical protein
MRLIGLQLFVIRRNVTSHTLFTGRINTEIGESYLWKGSLRSD